MTPTTPDPDEAVTPETRACGESPCSSYASGHHPHWIQAGHAGRAPWGWRDAVVEDVDGGWARLAYLEDAARPRVWHHAPLAEFITPGALVRLHERYHLLATPQTWLCVAIEGGAGPVPEPADAALWSGESVHAIVNLRTGRAESIEAPTGNQR